MRQPETGIIQKSRLLLVEGKDEINFFGALLKILKIDDIDLREVGGKNNFPNELPALLNDPGFSNVQSYAIIRDADSSHKNTLASVKNLLKKYKQPVPASSGHYADENGVRAGIYIMPGNADIGMLEDLCIQSVADHPITGCVNAYIKCLEQVLEKRKGAGARQEGCFYFPKNLAKAKAQTFLAGLEEIYSSVGIAAQKGCWNLNHESLKPLRAFLQNL